MYCIRCGRQVQAEASFCWNCGAAIGAPPAGHAAPPPPEAADAGTTVLPAAIPGAGTAGAAPGWSTFDPANPPAAPVAPSTATAPAGGQWARPFEPSAGATPAADVPAPEASVRPGGFWRRVVAAFIDSILLNILNMPFALLWVSPFVPELEGNDLSPERLGALLNAYVLAGSTAFLLSWLYHAGLECSSAQATLGKMAMGVKVVNGRLGRLGFAHASGRFLAKIPCNLTFGIGYVIAAFTARKRGLHDMIAGTLVIRG